MLSRERACLFHNIACVGGEGVCCNLSLTVKWGVLRDEGTYIGDANGHFNPTFVDESNAHGVVDILQVHR